MSEDYEFLPPADGDDGFFEPGNPPAAPDVKEETLQTEVPPEEQQTQQLQNDEGAGTKEEQTAASEEDQTGKAAEASESELENLKPFLDEAGNLRAADLSSHLVAARSMIGRQSNEIGQLRATVRSLEATRNSGANGAAGQSQQQKQQQEQQGGESEFKIPEESKGLLQPDDIKIIQGVVKELVGKGVRGELSGLAKQSEEFQTAQVQQEVQGRKDILNATLGNALEYVGSFSSQYSDIPSKVVYNEVMNDPEIKGVISQYVDHANAGAFDEKVAHQIAVRVYSRLADKLQSQASAHLQSQSGPQFSPKVIPVKPISKEAAGPQRTPEELEVLGSFA